MGTMRTADDPKNYQPTTLIAPDGREFTPSSLREHNEVIGLGYRPAPTPPAEHEPEPTETQPPAETSPGEAQTEPSSPVAPDETATPAETSAPAETLSGEAQSDEAADVPSPAPAPFAAPRRKASK